MTRTVRASRSVFAARNFPPPESIWISDARLAESFHRFARIPSRHGSNVPGPMESRRRANKRRNTSLAQIGPGPPIDPDVLFETGPHNAWWQTASPASLRPAVDSVPHFLPSWLAQPAPSPPSPHWPGFPNSVVKPLLGHSNRSLTERFRLQLKSTGDLDQLREIVKRLGIDLAHDPVHSELAFDHVLTSHYSLASEFLLDPRLNSATAGNYNKIVLHLQEHVVGEEQRKSLLQALFKGFSVGLVRREEAQSILQTLPDIKIDAKDGPVAARQTPKASKYYSVILKCLADCSVFSTRDLGVDIIKAWIRYASEIPCDRYAADLILSLTKSVALLQARERFEPSSRAFQVFLSHAEITATSDLTKRWLTFLCQDPARRERGIGQLAQFLRRRPPALLRSVLLGIPERLVASVRSDKLSSDAFIIWEQVLHLFDKETAVPVLGKNSIWTKKVSQTEAGLPADARLVLRLWTALVLCGHAEEPLRVFKEMDFPSRLRDQYKEHDPVLLWNHICQTLQSLPKLPFRGQLFDFFNKFQQPPSRTHVIRAAKHEAVKHEAVLDTFAARGFAVLVDDEAYLHALRYLNDPLKELAESVNQDMAGFARILLPLIAQDKLSLRIVTRLLKHNRKFHFALMKSWPPLPAANMKVANPGDPATGVSGLAELPDLPTTSDDVKFQETVLTFMHNLAVAFALSPALSDRQALRKVFWCFRFLHRYGAPVLPPITKALWYASVTRCEGKGTPRRVVLWVLRKIREVEGPATAEELVTNPEFRTKRAMEMWTWGRRLGHGRAGEDGPPRRLRGFESDAGWLCRLHASAPRSGVVQ